MIRRFTSYQLIIFHELDAIQLVVGNQYSAGNQGQIKLNPAKMQIVHRGKQAPLI